LGGSYLALDVTNEQSPDLLYESITKSFQPSAASAGASGSLVDAVVHNAGITRDKTFKGMSEDQFRTVLDVNLASIMRLDEMLLCRSRHVIGSGGRLVYLSSIAGIAGGFGQTNYSCSKAGVVGYVAARAADVSPWGIGVNAIAPGFIETEMTKAIPFAIRNIGRRMNALNQGGYPADIAEAALFLSSSASSALNGVTVRVCGKHRVGA
jgi:3-oxoacyl-[acyl-carrier protein] reductase